MLSEETRPVHPRRFSWQAWLALVYALLAYPIGWGNFGRLHPGLHALTNGSRLGWYSFWGAVFLIEWIGFFLCLWALRSEDRAVREIGLHSRRFRLYLVFFILAIAGFSGVEAPSRPLARIGLQNA